MNLKDMESVMEKVREGDDFIITSHVNPEGDSAGSQLAFFYALKKIGKNAVMVSQDDLPDNLKFLPGADSIGSESPEGFSPGVAIVLDCPVKERIGGVKRYLTEQVFVINIDHHVSNEFFGDVNWVEPAMSSVGEMAYHIIKGLGVEIDGNIAKAIYAAIITDTGMFNYDNTSGGTHEVVADLIDKGVKPITMHKEIFEKKSMMQIKMLGRVMAGIRVEENGLVAHISLTREMLREEGLTNVATDEFINYPRSIKGVEVAVFFKESVGDDRLVSVSFRSNGEVDVNEVATRFGGGGHKNASGCLISADLSEARDMVLNEVKEFLKGER